MKPTHSLNAVLTTANTTRYAVHNPILPSPGGLRAAERTTSITVDSFIVHSVHYKCFMISNQPNAHNYSLDIYITKSHIVSLHVSVRKEPSSGNKTKVKQHKTSLLCTFDMV